MKHYRKRLAQHIRALRGDQVQVAFAQRLGISQSSLQRIENEDQNVALDTLETICIRLNCEIGDLFPPLTR